LKIVVDENSLSKLLLDAQEGDGVAYELFLSKVSDMLIPFIRKKIDRNEFLEDILQETLISIHRSRHTYLPGRPLEAWVYVICDHRITDFYRKIRRVEKSELKFPEEIDHLVSFQEGLKEEATLGLDSLLDQLPEKQRRVITLMKIEGLSIKEVSIKLNMTVSSVKVTAFRGYETLKRLKGVL
jgi:RNA polymerase sigma-70 factor (ECF subfamily)